MGFHVTAGEEEEGGHDDHVETHGDPGEQQVRGQVHIVGDRVEEGWEEDDGCNGQVDVSKWVLELSARLPVRVFDVDANADGKDNRWGEDGRKEKQGTGRELTGSILATCIHHKNNSA